MSDCPLCGTWLCKDCGQKRGGRNRFYDGRHQCSCLSHNGVMLPVRHRKPAILEDHTGSAEEMVARGFALNYPLPPPG